MNHPYHPPHHHHYRNHMVMHNEIIFWFFLTVQNVQWSNIHIRPSPAELDMYLLSSMVLAHFMLT